MGRNHQKNQGTGQTQGSRKFLMAVIQSELEVEAEDEIDFYV